MTACSTAGGGGTKANDGSVKVDVGKVRRGLEAGHARTERDTGVYAGGSGRRRNTGRRSDAGGGSKTGGGGEAGRVAVGCGGGAGDAWVAWGKAGAAIRFCRGWLVSGEW